MKFLCTYTMMQILAHSKSRKGRYDDQEEKMQRVDRVNQGYFDVTEDSREDAKQKALQRWRAAAYPRILGAKEMGQS